MKRNVQWLGLFFLMILLFLTGCNQAGANKDSEIDPYNFYNQVELGVLKEDVDAVLGVEADEEEGAYIYSDAKSGFGVEVVYDFNNSVTMKTLYHDNEKEIMNLSDASVDQSLNDSLAEGMTYQEVKALLGSDGAEIIQVMNPADPNKAIHVIIWFNSDQTGIYASFLGDKGNLINAVYYE